MEKIAHDAYVNALNYFQIGDFVTLITTGSDTVFYGIIVDICPKEQKVYVEWSSGVIKQHDPSDIHLHPFLMNKEVQQRLRSRHTNEYCVASLTQTENRPEVGDPKNRGIEEPVSGGFNEVQNLIKTDRKEHKLASKIANEVIEAVYHDSAGRVYKRSQNELENDTTSCPKCKGDMDLQPFTKSVKIYICPDCGWKITF